MQIVDFFVVGNSRVMEVLYADGVRGACDLNGVAEAVPFEPELTEGGRALRWPDGTVLDAERLRDLCLKPSPAARPGSMVAEIAYRLHDPVERGEQFMTLTHTWVAGEWPYLLGQ